MISKLIAALISPLGTALLIWLIAFFLRKSKYSLFGFRFSFIACVVAFSWLWIWSMPVASDALRGWIENQAGERLLADISPGQVAVVLGGGVSGPRPPRRPDPDLGSASDRLWYAARIYRAGKAKRIILSGGYVRTGDGSEAQAMRRFLVDLGVPVSAIELENGSVNTVANAALTSQLLKAQGLDSIILITSALHMPRARSAFERAGLRVTAAPTDFEIIDMPFDLLRVIPDSDALHGSSRAMKEIVGRFFSR